MSILAVPLKLPSKLKPLYPACRYKVLHGGRGGGKSWGVAKVLVTLGLTEKLRILCAREIQLSIKESVHRLLSDQIWELGLNPYYEITKESIRGINGTEFIFKGLRHNPQEIKSIEGIDICWVEEAQLVSKESWDVLTPTIRKEGSEIWITMNPMDASDYTYKHFVETQLPGSVVIQILWSDNKWFPKVLDDERKYLLSIDPEAHEHIWNGACRTVGDAVIFKGKYSVEYFETPESASFYHGADWGFSQDPTALIRSFISEDGETLYIDNEVFGYGIEMDHLPALFAGDDIMVNPPRWKNPNKTFGMGTSLSWPIKADGARPETISYMKRHGFNIRAAEKWKGSIEDGIEHLKGFRRIVVHPRCKNVAQEMRLYSYKVDRYTGLALPVIIDRHNHGIDALRYSLDGYIRARGGLGQWSLLAK